MTVLAMKLEIGIALVSAAEESSSSWNIQSNIILTTTANSGIYITLDGSTTSTIIP
jgi:uncharacterized hydantoinase/oxoprolinase family protein